jgi:hypothetical protein
MRSTIVSPSLGEGDESRGLWDQAQTRANVVVILTLC